MGRGSAYPYQFFMLFDDVDDDPEIGDTTWEQIESFLRQWAPGWAVTGRQRTLTPHRDIYTVLDCPKMWVGLDGSGGLPCVVAIPKDWENRQNGTDGLYNITRDVTRLFNRLIQSTAIDYRKPSTAWTSYSIRKYE